MDRLLVAINGSPTSGSVLATGRWLSELLHLGLDVVHVREQPEDEVGAPAAPGLRVLEGSPAQRLGAELGAEDVRAAVIGARGEPDVIRSIGHIAASLILHADKPVVVVPPDCQDLTSRRRSRMLVPLDGTDSSARAVERSVDLLAGAGMEVIVLHVFGSHNVPRFWDQSHHAAESWRREFMARFSPGSQVNMRLRRGVPGESVLTVADQEEVGLIAMGWSQDLSDDHAVTLRHVLSGTRCPVVLLPVGSD